MYTERDGARLFWNTQGAGPDLVLLHPTPVHHAFWQSVADRLAPHFRLTWIDLRGHGQSTLGRGPVTMEKMAEDVHTVLRDAGIRQAAFAGCSIGGYVLYEIWRRFPQDVSALAFICGKPQPDSADSHEKRQDWMRSAQQPGGLAKNFDLMADTLIGPTAQRRQPQLRANARAMMDAASLEAMIAVQQGLMTRPDSVPTIKTISVPVCVVAGAEDQISLPSDMHVIAEQLPRAEFHLLPETGHYAPLEQPDRVAAILENFLRSKGQSTPVSPVH